MFIKRRKNIKTWQKICIISLKIIEQIIGVAAVAFAMGGWMLCAIVFNW